MPWLAMIFLFWFYLSHFKSDFDCVKSNVGFFKFIQSKYRPSPLPSWSETPSVINRVKLVVFTFPCFLNYMKEWSFLLSIEYDSIVVTNILHYSSTFTFICRLYNLSTLIKHVWVGEWLLFIYFTFFVADLKIVPFGSSKKNATS